MWRKIRGLAMQNFDTSYGNDENAFEHIYFAILGNENFQVFQQVFRKCNLSGL